MEEEFYSTIKLTSGEEIVAKVCYLKEENSLLIENPKLVDHTLTKKNGKNIQGFILKDWINATYDTMFVIKMEQVITMSELDKRIEQYYLMNLDDNSLEQLSSTNVNPKSFNRRMGYLGSIKETKRYLEDIFNKS